MALKDAEWVCGNCGKTGLKRFRLPRIKAAVLSVVLLAPMWGDICETCKEKVDVVFIAAVVVLAISVAIGLSLVAAKFAA